MAAALLIVGALLVIGGVSVIYWPAGLIVAGLFGLAGGVDLTRRTASPGEPA